MPKPSTALADQPSEGSRNKDRRTAVLQAALEVFAEQGFNGTPVPPIADRAGVGVGTIYRYFADKEALVNEVFRHAKRSLQSALTSGIKNATGPRQLFDNIWSRLVEFAREEPLMFRFLEMQDHGAYLDTDSKAVEAELLAPIIGALHGFREQGLVQTPMQTAPLIAMLWGGVVGLFKFERAGYYNLQEQDLNAARDTIWLAITAADASQNQSEARS